MASNIIRAAVIDLYNGVGNQGMRGIKEILTERSGKVNGQTILYDIYEARNQNEMPDDNYDLYISSGGPGSHFDGENQEWELKYFRLIDKLWNHNQKSDIENRKHVFFICHSFQMACRFFDVAEVNKRKSNSFGVLPIHKTTECQHDEIFKNLPEPFYAVDSRDWQAVQPNHKKLKKLGAKILALEKLRPHVDLERAVMAIRFSPEFLATQFHPEADPTGMLIHFQKEERRQSVITTYGEKKYHDMINHMNDRDKINLTHTRCIPEFITKAIKTLREAESLVEMESYV
jgi:GMP synthase-like glutamine amidotransferase